MKILFYIIKLLFSIKIINSSLSVPPAQVLTGSSDNITRLYDLNTGKCLKSILLDAPIRLVSTSICRSNQYYYGIVSTAKNAYIFDFMGNYSRKINLYDNDYSHNSTEITVFINHVKNVVIQGLSDGQVKLFDIKKQKLLHTFQNKGQSVRQLVISPENDKLLLTSLSDKTIKLQDLDTQSCQSTLIVEDQVSVVNIDIFGKYVAIGLYNGSVQIYLVIQKELELILELPSHTNAVNTLAFGVNKLISGDNSGKVNIQCMQDRTWINSFIVKDGVSTLAFTSDKEHILVGTNVNSLLMFTLKWNLVREFTGMDSNSLITSIDTSTCDTLVRNKDEHSEVLDDGSVYTGAYINGLKHGKGVFKYFDGSIYTGDFAQNDIHGIGKLSWADGRVYEGGWKNNIIHGYGEFTWLEGQVQKGNYKDGKKHGFGKLWTQNQVQIGHWKDGQKHGDGMMTKDGQWMRGLWYNGKVINTGSEMGQGVILYQFELKQLMKFNAMGQIKYLLIKFNDQEMLSEKQNKLFDLFSEQDKNQDGWISKYDFVHMTMNNGQARNLTEAQELLGKLQTKEDEEEIEFIEFYQLFE